ncbi:efflux RND transporter periplasmic adaptor subunit [Amantichitinum ursilacus]|uniref:Multidrug resistance protein MexA n=1 Tax=Amantichitinum ursilacus TaxID=857265 RepID=A0A0N0XIL6_9NEIS|nr:efflux RND transporter periplasmic adaptor subunit [Amantichitinum ursilacus]KPC52859.1 Multidrug resistance protein MexA precursor [Amantichitinum ursilacus]
MAKRMIIMLIVVGVIFGGIFGFQIFKGQMIKKYLANQHAPAETVTATHVGFADWQPTLSAVGTLRAVRGVDLSSEVAGQVREVLLKSGTTVKAGEVLVRLNDDTEVAQLRSLQAAAELSNTTLKRDKAQLEAQAISQAVVDADIADLNSKNALVAQQQAVIAKKTIRAPFSGKVGITTVNPGQYINPGDKLASLQTVDPILVDFLVPQQALSQLKIGQTVQIKSDANPNAHYQGKITAVDAKVDSATRNIQVEAAVANPKGDLLAGMFATAQVSTTAPIKYLTLPQTAVAFNPYGEVVFLISNGPKDDKGNVTQVVKQTFVTAGQTRGDQVAITAGLKEGDYVVTNGQHKLKNGSTIVVNNKVAPSDSANPVVGNED